MESYKKSLIALSFFWSIVSLVRAHGRSDSTQSQSIQILGLFTLTNCPLDEKLECENALANQESILKMHEQTEFWYNTLVCFNDVKNDPGVMAGILFPIVANESTPIECQNKGGIYTRGLATAMVILTHMSFYLTRFAAFLVLPSTPVLLVSITDELMQPSYYLDHPHAIFSYEAGFGVDMHEQIIAIKNDMNITYGAFFNLLVDNNNNNSGDDITNQLKSPSLNTVCPNHNQVTSAMCFYRGLNPADCFKEIDIYMNNETRIEEVVARAKLNGLSFIVLAGDSRSIGEFTSIQKTEYQSFNEEYLETFFVPFVTKKKNVANDKLFAFKRSSYKDGTVFSNFPGSLAINKLFYFILDFPNILLKDLTEAKSRNFVWSYLLENDKFQKYFQEPIICFALIVIDRSFKCGDRIGLKHIRLIPRPLIASKINELMRKTDHLESLILYWKKNYYIENIDHRKLLALPNTLNPRKALQSRPFCSEKKPRCKAGKELTYSAYKEPFWKQSIGWHCQTCPPMHFKHNSGSEEKCQPCADPYIVNQNSTRCYDPYIRSAFSVTDPVIIGSIIIPSVLMSLLTMFTMVMFLVHRDTPIVLSANRKMTAIQLTCHLILFTAPTVLYLLVDNTTPLICISRQVILGVGFTITISINISKSQKLHMIITKNVLMTRSEIIITNASEWLIIAVALFVNASLHVMSLVNKPVTVLTKYHDVSLTKEAFCSNDTMIYVQLLMATLLSVCNGVQGFRGRNFPSIYRETNHVIYSSFISVVVFVAVTVAYFTNEKMLNRSFLVLIVMVVVNTTHFVLLYGYKMFVMLFRQHQNTKQALAKKRLQKIEIQ